MEDTKSSIFYLPGLGADDLLFSELISKLPGQCLSWPEADSSQDLMSFAGLCFEKWNLPPNAVLIGFSFGGMVAKSIFKSEKTQGSFNSKARLVMLSSCRTKNSIDPLFKKRVKFLKFVPDVLLRFALVVVGTRFVANNRPLTEKHKNILRRMARSTNLSFFRWAAKACAEWTLDDFVLGNVPSLQIHGEFDEVIPCPNGEADIVIEGAGHLLPFESPERLKDEILAFLKKD